MPLTLVLLLLVTLNGVASENLLLTTDRQTGNQKSETPGTNQQLGRISDSVQLEPHSGNLDVEEPLLYGFFPAGFLWGAATSALQVSDQPDMESSPENTCRCVADLLRYSHNGFSKTYYDEDASVAWLSRVQEVIC